MCFGLPGNMLCQRALNARRDLLTALQDMLQIMVHELPVPEKRPALHIDAVDLLAASGIEQIRQNVLALKSKLYDGSSF